MPKHKCAMAILERDQIQLYLTQHTMFKKHKEQNWI